MSDEPKVNNTRAVAVGVKINMLTALHPMSPKGRTWLFKCDCGVEKVIDRRFVELGRTMSCGCLRKNIASEANYKRKKTRK